MRVRATLAFAGGVWLLATTAHATATELHAPYAAAQRKGRCRGVDSVASGGALVTTIPANVGGRRYKLEVTTVAAPDMPRSSTLVLSTGHRTWMRSEATASGSGFTLTVELDAGARGVQRMELASTDGVTATGTVDGRALVPFAVGGDAAPQFADGGDAPKLKVKPLLRRVLRKTIACASPPSSSSVVTRALISSCDLCNAGCGLAFAGCGLGTLLSAAAGVGIPTIALNISSCEKALFDCAKACATGSACCPVPCAGGHGISIGDHVCEATCSEGAVCCGGAAHPNGTCCDSSDSCCGPFCIDTTVGKCVNPTTGAYCQLGQGDLCGDASMPGPFAFCCPNDKPVCRDTSQHVCCPQGAGQVCLIDGEMDCCPADTPFCSQGTAQGCCAEQVCCDPPQSKCGNTCCDPLTQVCANAGTSTCAEAPPDVVIDQPDEGDHVFEDTPITLAGHDLGLGRCQTSPQSGHWTSDNVADQIPANGCMVTATLHGTGQHLLTFTVNAAGGTPGSTSVHVTVDPKPAVVASILAPSDGTSINVDNCDDLELDAYATGAQPLTLTWTWQADQLGCAPFTMTTSCPIQFFICTVQPPPDTYFTYWHSCGPPEPPCIGTGTMQLQVTDMLNQTANAKPVNVTIVRNPH
jgi:hypothetical protein